MHYVSRTKDRSIGFLGVGNYKADTKALWCHEHCKPNAVRCQLTAATGTCPEGVV